MVDYIKLAIASESVANYVRDKYCTQVDNVELKTGDLFQACYVGTIGNEFKVRVFQSNRVELRGSLHKYYAQGTNSGDFTFSMVCDAVKRLAAELQTTPKSLILENLEIGVNLILLYSPNKVLENVVCVKSGAQFNIRKEGLRECLRTVYRHKIYNKSAQYGITDKHILRYELHFDKMRNIKPVKTLQDLAEIQHWYMFQQILLKHFAEIVFVDYYPDWETLTEPERKFLMKHSKNINNQRFWKGLKYKNRHDIFNSMKRLQDQKGDKKYSLLLTGLIEQKTNELISL